MSKPDWKDAPTAAEWLTCDSGGWYWWTDEPGTQGSRYVSDRAESLFAGHSEKADYWHKEPRP